MRRLFKLAIATGFALTVGALAGHAQSPSDSQRGEFGKMIREYLIANPEVLQDALNELEKRKASANSANDGQRDATLPKAQGQGAPAMAAGCPCMEMMSGGMSGMMQRDAKGSMNMPGTEGMAMSNGMMPPSPGGPMGGMNAAGGSGCCALPQQQAAAGRQPGDKTLLAGAEELLRTNPLLTPNPPNTSITGPAATIGKTLEKWSGRDPDLFTLKKLSSSEVALSDYRGKPVILHFFATWCGPCREEMEALRRFVSRTQSDSLSVLAVSVGEPEDRVRRFFDAVPVNFTVLLDRDMAVTRAWRVDMLPTTYVLNAELKPRVFMRGEQKWDQLDATQILGRMDEANRDAGPPGGRPVTAPTKAK